MCVRRAKKSTTFNCNVKVHEGLEMVLAAHRIWKASRYPLSPWYIPGRCKTLSEGEGDEAQGADAQDLPTETGYLKHADKGALTKALNRLYQVYATFRKSENEPKKFPEKAYLTRKYTSHGAGRAFYIYARRCQGALDTEICYEVNHTGGVGTLEQVYGLPAKHWQNGDAPGMDWLPKDPKDYAWNKIKGVDFSGLDEHASPPADFSI
jgi:hypothetical protein